MDCASSGLDRRVVVANALRRALKSSVTPRRGCWPRSVRRGDSDVIAPRRRSPDDTELEEIDDSSSSTWRRGQTDLARAHHQLRTQGKTEAAKGLADSEHGTDLELLVNREAEAALDGGASAEQAMSQYSD